jgi:hypothetical protein
LHLDSQLEVDIRPFGTVACCGRTRTSADSHTPPVDDTLPELRSLSLHQTRLNGVDLRRMTPRRRQTSNAWNGVVDCE